jgi:hypothetical protein
MLDARKLLPRLPDLVGGFVHVVTVPHIPDHAFDGVPIRLADLVSPLGVPGLRLEDCRLLPAGSDDPDTVWCAFREWTPAAMLARCSGGDLVSLPAGMPGMVTRTLLLAKAYWYAERYHPTVPLAEIARDKSSVEPLPYFTYQDRAVAVLASRSLANGPLTAVVQATGMTEAFGLTPSSAPHEESPRGIELSANEKPRCVDPALIQGLASAYARARQKHPTVPVEVLLRLHSRWAVLRDVAPRLRAIALAAVALGKIRGTWQVDRAAMLIDGADDGQVVGAVLRRANRVADWPA